MTVAIPRNLIPELDRRLSPRMAREFLRAIEELKAQVAATGFVVLIDPVAGVPFDLTTISSGARLGNLQVVYVDALTIVESTNRTGQFLPSSREELLRIAAGDGPNAGPARQMVQRQAALQEFIRQGRNVSLAEIGIDFNRDVQFTNGRNRFLTAFYNGAKEIPVAVTPRDARIMESRGWVTKRAAVSNFNQRLLAGLASGNVDSAMTAIPLRPDRLAHLEQQLRQTYRIAGDATADGIPPRRAPALRANFDVTNPRAEQFLAERSATLIREINGGQRAMIRTVITEGLEAGRNPNSVALDLVGRIDPRTGRRVGGHIGLTQKQSGFVSNYRNELASSRPADLNKALKRGLRDRRFDGTIRKAIRDKTPIPTSLQQRMSTQYEDRLLRFRAQTIGRTETLRAVNHANQEALRQAVQQNVIRANQVRRFWVTAGDDRVRDDHAAVPGMNSEGVGLNEQFDTPLGAVDHPPLEIQCRCFVETRIDFISELGRG